MSFFSIKLFVLFILVGCTTYVQYRGRRRLKFLRQLEDHSMFMAPINCLIYLFSGVKNRPFLPVEDFPELLYLRKNWEVIREEGLQLQAKGLIQGSTARNDAAFNTFFKRGWKRFYLKWYDTAHPSAAELCPKSVEILKQAPQIKAAMFSFLPAGGKLGAHRDPYAGSLRYHLGLVTPNDDACHIFIDGEKYSWRDGQDVLFDETYIHEAYNRTEQDRLILFCDVARPMRTAFGKWLTAFCDRTIMRGAGSPNQAGDRTGAINQIFMYPHELQQMGQRLKHKNRRLYYALKYSLMGLVFYWLFF
jgi:beta-hydroxylase